MHIGPHSLKARAFLGLLIAVVFIGIVATFLYPGQQVSERYLEDKSREEIEEDSAIKSVTKTRETQQEQSYAVQGKFISRTEEGVYFEVEGEERFFPSSRETFVFYQHTAVRRYPVAENIAYSGIIAELQYVIVADQEPYIESITLFP